MNPAHIPIKASTQEHLSIEDIKDNIVILKDGSCCLILQTSAVNFDLLSETEQDATIYAYAGLLNSLSFPIQIFIRSQQKDISSYLKLLKKERDKQKTTLQKKQIAAYQKFIEKTVKENRVLDKSFYLVIPFSLLELGVSQTIKKAGNRKNQLPFSKEYILNKAKTNLYPKRDHIIKQFQRLGLKIKQLNTRQLIKLFYRIYNPYSKGQLLGSPSDYTSFLVKTNLKEKNKKTAVSLPTKPTNPVVKKPPVSVKTKTEKTTPLEGLKLQKAIDNIFKKVGGKNKK